MKNEMTKLNGRVKVEYPLKQGLKPNNFFKQKNGLISLK